MKRSFKALVVTGLALALSLSFATAFAQKENKPPKPTKAPQVAITSIALTLTDRQDNVLSPDASGAYTVVSGWKFVAKAVLTPEDAKASLRWRSSKPFAASVNNRGVIFCNRPGTATITVRNKSGEVKQAITLNVNENMTAFDTTADKTVKKIYLRGNNLCIDVVLVNLASETLETAPDLAFSLQLSGETGYTELGTKSGHLRKSIAAGETGTATYKVKKVDAKSIWLLNAQATCQTP